MRRDSGRGHGWQRGAVLHGRLSVRRGELQSCVCVRRVCRVECFIVLGFVPGGQVCWGEAGVAAGVVSLGIGYVLYAL